MLKPIIFFYQSNCSVCDDLMLLVNDFVQEEGLEIEMVDLDTKNGEDLFVKYEKGKCGGVPFLFNPNNQKTVCGLVTKKELSEFLLNNN